MWLAWLGRAADVAVPWSGPWQWRWSTEDPAGGGAWREAGFVADGAWTKSPAPFRRSDGSGTRLPSGQGAWLGRIEFTVADARLHERIRLRGLVAGGAVAWINGVEVFRDGVPDGVDGVLGFALPGSSSVRTRTSERARWDLPGWTTGTNVLAVMLLPETASAEMYWNAQLEADVDVTPPGVAVRSPDEGATTPTLDVVEAIFTEPVQGLDADDLLFNGVPAVAVTPVAGDHYAFVPPPLTTGPVEVRWRADAGITDRSAAANVFAGGAWTVAVQQADAASQVVVSEVMTDNDRTLRDEDGDSPDWIELHNPTDQPVSLSGWGLSDDPAQPLKWRLPEVVLAARAFLLVHASGKDRTNGAGRLHTNFKLDAGGEFLGLSDAAGKWVSTFAPKIPPLGKDVSYGRATGVPEVAGFMGRPTPGAANAASGTGYAPDIAFSRPSGTYAGTATVALSLSRPDPNAVIRYTTNNSAVTATSAVYGRPLVFSTAVHLRARAFSPGLLPGPPTNATYTPLM
ncbi:MAG: hypothetical protein RL153_2417, partial [Verrucomicrobiota bacterium]